MKTFRNKSYYLTLVTLLFSFFLTSKAQSQTHQYWDGGISSETYKLFLPWASSANKTIREVLEESRSMAPYEKRNFLLVQLRKVYEHSQFENRRYHSFMQTALFRALELSDLIETYSYQASDRKDHDSQSIRAQQVSLQNQKVHAQIQTLISGAKLALQFYQSDKDFQANMAKGKINWDDFKTMGVAMASVYFKNVTQVSSAKAQYAYFRTVFENLNKDLTQDKDAKNYAQVIVTIYRTLRSMPSAPKANDQSNLNNIRRLYKLLEKIKQHLPQVCLNKTCSINRKKNKVIPSKNPMPVEKELTSYRSKELEMSLKRCAQALVSKEPLYAEYGGGGESYCRTFDDRVRECVTEAVPYSAADVDIHKVVDMCERDTKAKVICLLKLRPSGNITECLEIGLVK